MKSKPIPEYNGFPTVLVAEDDEQFRHTLAENLRWEGYHVLEAYDEADAYQVITVHSRVIHLLLIDMSIDGASATRPKQYQSKLQVLFITKIDDIGAMAEGAGVRCRLSRGEARGVFTRNRAATPAGWGGGRNTGESYGRSEDPAGHQGERGGQHPG